MLVFVGFVESRLGSGLTAVNYKGVFSARLFLEFMPAHLREKNTYMRLAWVSPLA